HMAPLMLFTSIMQSLRLIVSHSRAFHPVCLRLFLPITLLAALITGCGKYQQQRQQQAAASIRSATFAELSESARSGNVAAQCELGYRYLRGQAIMKDETEALKWFRKAADKNLPEAQYAVALAYDKGQGVEASTAEAAVWFRKSAQQGDPKAQF